MIKRRAFSVTTLLFSFLSAICVLTISEVALAQPVEGCDQRVLTAMQKKAQAKVAYDIAVTEEIIDKPDSVLAMTCFNQAASISAVKGGQIFSNQTANGFIPNLSPIITTSLAAFYDDFDDAVGFLTGSVDYSAAATLLSPTAAYECNGIADLWDEVKDEGIQTSVPYVSMTDFLTPGSPLPAGAAATSDFAANWQSAQAAGVFSQLQTAVTALPTAPVIPSFAGNNSSCQVLVTLGQAAGPCP